MRPLLVGLAIFSASGLLFAACSQDPTSAATGGTGGAPNCEGVYIVYGDEDGGEPCDIVPSRQLLRGAFFLPRQSLH